MSAGSSQPAVWANSRLSFIDAVTPIVWDLFAWNAPDDEHTRHQLRSWLDEVITEVEREREQA